MFHENIQGMEREVTSDVRPRHTPKVADSLLPPKLGCISPTFSRPPDSPPLPLAMFLPWDSLAQKTFSFAQKILPSC